MNRAPRGQFELPQSPPVIPRRSRGMPAAPPAPGTPLADQGTPFYFELFNRDLGVYPVVAGTFYTVATFTAPPNQLALIVGLSVFPDQLEALADVTYQVTIQGDGVPYLGLRYGQIGDWGDPEPWRVEVPAGQVFRVDAKLSQDIRAVPGGGVDSDQRIEFTTRVWGVMMRGHR